MADFEAPRMRPLATGWWKKVESRRAFETDGLDDFQIWRENHAWRSAVGGIEYGINILPVAGETLGGISGFHAVIQRHRGNGAVRLIGYP